MSTSTPIWDFLTNKHQVDFDLPPNDTVNLHTSTTLESLFSGLFVKSNSINNEYKLNEYQYSKLLPLLKISSENKIDLSELLLTQYQLSNLSVDKFINNCALLNELRQYTQSNNDISSVQYKSLNIFTNFLKTYNKYIYKPLPISYDQLPNTFQLYDDKIDVVLDYMMEINNILNRNIINANSKQFDVYFVPPNDTTDFEKFYMSDMGYSGPDSRYVDRSGLDDIYSLFCSKDARKLIHELQISSNKRLILLIIRGNEYNTNNDILYLFNKNISNTISNEHNEILWNLSNSKDFICNKSLADLFNISYHLHSQNNNCKRIYMYYNGYGVRICKRNIVNKLPFIFTSKNGKNIINKYLAKQFLSENKNAFNDFIYTDNNYTFGKYLFGLKYEKQLCNNIKQRLFNVPKTAIKSNIVEIREFDDPENQLYYYLTWTCKMQVLDGEFSEYTFRDNNNGDQFNEIAIFNSELHEKYSNSILYVICIRNNNDKSGKPKWNMYNLQTTTEIYTTYGITSDDLPTGSRHIHNYFQKEITRNNLHLYNDIIPVKNWNKVRIILSQKFKGDSKPNLNNCNLNYYIQEAINNIQSNENNLALIPILRIDTHTEEIVCDPLIPVILPNGNIAISYNTLNKKIVINAIFIDPIDIISKAALVDAYAVNTYKYMLNTAKRTSINCFEDIPDIPMPTMNRNWSIGSNTSNLSAVSFTDQSWTIQSLQQQLNSALLRENMIVKMLTNSIPNISMPNTSNATPGFIYNFSKLQSPSCSVPGLQNISTNISNLQLPSPLTNYNNINNFYNNQILSFPNTQIPSLQQTKSPAVNMPNMPNMPQMPLLSTQIIHNKC